MERVARPQKIGYALLLLYMIALSFLSVHLLEENRKLREELRAWESLRVHVAPSKKPRFYHRR